MTTASNRLAQRAAATTKAQVLYSATFRHDDVLGTLALQFTPSGGTTTAPPPPTGPTVPAGVAWQSTVAGYWANGGYNLNGNPWNAGHGPQTIYAFNYHDWGVIASEPAGNTAVETYPFVEYPFYASSNPSGKTYPLLSELTDVTVTYAQTMPTSDGVDAEAAFDLWVGTVDVAANDYSNAWSNEIMIWVQNHGQTPAGSQEGTLQVGTVDYELWATSDNSTVSLVMTEPLPAGTVDVLGALKALQAAGRLPADAVFTSLQFGWEICSTNGEPLEFTCTSYGVTVA